MSPDESLEEQRKRGSEFVSPEAIEWGNQFLKILELEYNDAAAELPAKATWVEFRQVMIRAVVATLVESGADLGEIRRLIQDSVLLDQEVEKNARWTSECNARRIELIDKMIQQTLSAEESVELDQLTARLRVHVDKEELVPLQGARQIHRRLLESGNPDAPPE